MTWDPKGKQETRDSLSRRRWWCHTRERERERERLSLELETVRRDSGEENKDSALATPDVSWWASGNEKMDIESFSSSITIVLCYRQEGQYWTQSETKKNHEDREEGHNNMKEEHSNLCASLAPVFHWMDQHVCRCWTTKKDYRGWKKRMCDIHIQWWAGIIIPTQQRWPNEAESSCQWMHWKSLDNNREKKTERGWRWWSCIRFERRRRDQREQWQRRTTHLRTQHRQWKTIWRESGWKEGSEGLLLTCLSLTKL